MPEQCVPEGLHLVERTHTGAVCEWEGLHAEVEVQHDEEVVAVTKHYESITAPTSHLCRVR